MAATRVTLGRVAGVYGVRGWLRVHSQTRPAEKILDYRRWWILQHGEAYAATVLDGHAQGSGLVAQISDAQGQAIADRDIAASLLGAEIQVDRADMPRLPEGQYYWIDLIGLKVENEAGVPLGQVRDVTSNGPQDVLVVSDDVGAERLIPFVRPQIVKNVELDAGRIVCDWDPEF
jgi:16S rRNA processing protein RimM